MYEINFVDYNGEGNYRHITISTSRHLWMSDFISYYKPTLEFSLLLSVEKQTYAGKYGPTECLKSEKDLPIS